MPGWAARVGMGVCWGGQVERVWGHTRLGRRRDYGGTSGRAVGWEGVSPLDAQMQLGRAGSFLLATAIPRVLLWSDAPL